MTGAMGLSFSMLKRGRYVFALPGEHERTPLTGQRNPAKVFHYNILAERSLAPRPHGAAGWSSARIKHMPGWSKEESLW